MNGSTLSCGCPSSDLADLEEGIIEWDEEGYDTEAGFYPIVVSGVYCQKCQDKLAKHTEVRRPLGCHAFPDGSFSKYTGRLRLRPGSYAREILRRYDTNCVVWGDLSMLSEIYTLAGYKCKNKHPLCRLKRVMDNLAADAARPGALIEMVWGRWGRGSQLCRGFWLAGTYSKG